MNWRWLLALLGAWHILPAAAAEFTLPELMRTLAAVPSAQARFTETRQLAMLETPLVLKGWLYYTRPDRIEKHVLSPHDERTRIAGDAVTIENRSRKRTTTLSLASTPAVQAFVESLRATLSGDLTALERHYLVRLEGRRDDWTLALTPKEPALSSLVKDIRIQGAGERLVSVQVEEAGGDLSVMLITQEKP